MAEQIQQSIDASSQSTANTNAITSEAVVPEQATEVNAKKRKLTSHVWGFFTRECIGGSNKVIATCNGCNRKFDGSSKAGTAHLKNHHDVCPHSNKSVDIRQAFIGKSVDNVNPSNKIKTHKFDPSVERVLFAKMIAKHDFPFLMSQYEYFRHWISYCMPSYKFRSRNTVKNDVMEVYNEEKGFLVNVLGNLNSRVTLTTDGWTSDHQNRGYFCVTCHYIDSDWILQSKLLAFHVVEYPHNGLRLCDWLKNRILEWNIDEKLFSVVVDNASQNFGMLDGIKDWLNRKGALLHHGEMFHIRCSAHIMNLIVKKGMDVIQGLIGKIRDSVKYVNGSVQREEKFHLALVHTRLNSKRRVSLECDTRWNSTYDMLMNAFDLKEAFKRLAELDSSYIYLPSKEEWEVGAKICKHLKIFKTATEALSGSKYPTAPLYFTFVCQIRESLKEWCESIDHDISTMALLMQTKFDKYWDECSMVLTIASILDPRYKMTLVKAAFGSNDDDNPNSFVSRVRTFWNDLFMEYDDQVSSVDVGINTTDSSRRIDNLSNDEIECPLLTRFRKLAAQSSATSISKKSEIELYLEEGLVCEQDNTFDVLNWWKHNGARYPILSKLARDILAIPCTTVPSESTFSRARRVIEDTRASLNSDTVEALLCVKDWLPTIEGEGAFIFKNVAHHMEKFGQLVE